MSKLLSLEVDNFLSIQKLRLDFNLSTEPVVLRGVNGAGKSSVLEAVVWALTGSTLRGLRGDAVCRHGSRDTRVLLRFDDHLDVARYRNHKYHKNTLLVQYGPDDLTQGTAQLTQQRLYDLLGHTEDTLLTCAVFGQLQAGLSSAHDTAVKELLERLFGRDGYQRAEDHTRQQVSELRTKTKELQIQLQAKQDALGSAQATLETIQQENATLENERRQDAKVLNQQIKALQQAIKVGQLELSLIKPNLDDAETLNTQREREAHDAWLQVKHTTHLLERNERELEDVQKQQGVCKACGQLVDAAHKAKHVAKLQAEGHDLQTKVFTLKKHEQEARKLHQQAEAALREATSEYRAKGQQVTDLASQLRLLKVASPIPKRKLYTGNVEEQIHQLRAECVELEASLKKATRTLEAHEFWVGGFGPKGLRDLVLWASLPSVESAANDILQNLTNDGFRLYMEQATTKTGKEQGKIAIRVNKGHQTVDLVECSGGERRKIDIALQLAIAQLTPLGFVLFDEWFDTLDTDSVDSAFELLRTVARTKTVLVATHHDRFEATYIVTKQNNTSQYTKAR